MITFKEAMQELSRALERIEATTTTTILDDDLANIQVSVECLRAIRKGLEAQHGKD